jgi:drug/metabolite transporter (DMT)-like permease
MQAAPPDLRPRAERAVLAILALLALALWLLLWRFAHTNLTLHTRAVQLVTFFAAYVVFLAAVAMVWQLGPRASRRTLWLIVLVGIAMRLSLAPVRPVTTWDVYRYLWEGRVVLAGENPFHEPPISPRLTALRDPLWKEVRFPRVPAAYPPAAQYVFAFSRLLPTEPVVTLKLLLALFDTGTVLLLPGLLLRLRRPPVWTLVYAWHPLIVGEAVARGHLDSIGIFLLVLAAVLVVGRRVEDDQGIENRESRVTAGLESARYAAAGAALAAGVLAKGYAIFAAPFFVIAARRRVWFVTGLLLTAVIAYLPFASAGPDLVRGLRLYATKWHDYAPVYPLFDLALARFTAHHDLIARRVLLAALGAWVLLLLFVRRERTASWALDRSFLALAGMFVLSPVLYSWYLSWTVPFLCLRPRPAWLLLTGTIFGFYAHAFAGPHMQVWWISLLQFGPPLLLALLLSKRSTGRSAERPREAVRLRRISLRSRRKGGREERPTSCPASLSTAPEGAKASASRKEIPTDEDQHREPARPRPGEHDPR